MNAHTQLAPAQIIERWLARFNAGVAARDLAALAACFAPDGHWRDVLALTWRIETRSGREALVAPLLAAASAQRLGALAVDPARCPPRRVERAGEPCVEAILRFETQHGVAAAVLRLRTREAEGQAPEAWTLLTSLAHLHGLDIESLRLAREEPAFERDMGGPNWLDRRRAAARYAERDPAVLVVGGGHAGLGAAACLGAMGIEALVVDRYARIGDNWRLRYHGLKLHNTVHSNHLPLLPFPSTWPNYIPKDKIANWLEFYAEAMELDVWTRTGFEGAEWDAAAGRWNARLTLADGSTRVLHPRHIVMATSVSSAPNLPNIPTLDRFGGTVLHSSRFAGGADWKGRPVFVFGTGTSAHDIAQDLHGHGARVTMVQRSPSLVVNVEPSAQLYDGIYHGEGPAQADRDLLNTSFPLPVMKQAHKLLTAKARALDAPLLEALERRGFRLEFGEDGTGWPLKYRTRGGGYYFNVGCSDLIADGKIGLVQHEDIAGFEAGGVRMKDGSLLEAELIVCATGYLNMQETARKLLGDAVADRIGPVWGFGEDGELRNTWRPTPQNGLWFTAGGLAQVRINSRPLALCIAAQEMGLA